jgi:hypothetical protein
VALRARRDFTRGRHLVRIRKRETGRAVIEFARVPGDSVVASGALGGWEIRGDVIGNITAEGLGTLPRGLMTAQAISVGGGEGVVVVDVAIGAGSNFARGSKLVRAGQWPTGRAVIKSCCCPGDGVVAGGTIRGSEGSASRRVRRIISLLPGRQVAAGVAAIIGLNVQGVVAADVTLGAGGDFACRRQLV